MGMSLAIKMDGSPSTKLRRIKPWKRLVFMLWDIIIYTCRYNNCVYCDLSLHACLSFLGQLQHSMVLYVADMNYHIKPVQD